jgi:hypothetical protein
MFYDAGRLYYTRSGDPRLYYRFFAPESGVIGTIEYIASGSKDGLDWSGVHGMPGPGSRMSIWVPQR